ncbi:MAG: carbohydrate binding family 9 domain-containing protein, partial [Cyclobacteriaceae bacterium]|nr:carbohydrate binding family 9 domain-containing protein [Cyclobacteriaceae bacterium]
VAILALDSEPEKIVRRMSRRDGFDGDYVSISIDSYDDNRTAFSFTASVSGVKSDEYISNNMDFDETWDPIWYLATQINEQGWVAEFRIPLSQLRFADKEEHTWGIQVLRKFFRNDERSVWQPISQEAPGWVHLFGELKGIRGIRPQKQFEVQPYLVAKKEKYPAEPGNPYLTGNDYSISAGLDAKIGITSDITLDLTVNPDFGQVEADPSQVNLTAFRLYFNERRPFFLEGNNILTFPIVGFTEDNLFYSRRIGGAPSFVPEADFVDQPRNTSILGAAKLTGKNSRGFSWGLLESLTREEKATYRINGEEKTTTVEPMTHFSVGRFQQDFKEGKTVVGAMATSTHRYINDSQLDFLHTDAQTGGVDLTHNFKDRKYGLTFRTLFSRVAGSEASIYASQVSSERFFQRPDNYHKDVDTTRNSLVGTASTVSFGKQSGNFLWEIGNTYNSPELDLNDAGFMVQTDFLFHWFFAQYRILKPVGIFRWQRMVLVGYQGFDFDAVRIDRGGEFNYITQLTNFWKFGVAFNSSGESVSNADLRGGPAIRYPGGLNYRYWIESNEQKKIAFEWNHWAYHGFEGYRQNMGFSSSLVVRPIDALRVTLSPTVIMGFNEMQYVDAFDRTAGETTYMLARADQEIYRMSVRANYNITPNLTIELWAQPFIAKVEYSRFKKALEPGATLFEHRFAEFPDSQVSLNPLNQTYYLYEQGSQLPDYTFRDPDFNTMEFRSNCVLRWEYIPGSILFLVWSGNAAVSTFHDQNDFIHLADDLLNLRSRNTFLIKYTYRFLR